MTCKCNKCDGQKTIQAFGHYANGVCFACGGSGVVECSPEQAKAIEAATKETQAKRSWLLSATDAAIRALPWRKIHAAHQFAVACVVCGDFEIEAILPRIKAAFEAASQA